MLSQLLKKDVVFDFRSNDILNEGEGAPLTPIFHHLLSLQYKIKLLNLFPKHREEYPISQLLKIIMISQN